VRIICGWVGSVTGVEVGALVGKRATGVGVAVLALEEVRLGESKEQAEPMNRVATSKT
jgi:hypothetical protein